MEDNRTEPMPGGPRTESDVLVPGLSHDELSRVHAELSEPQRPNPGPEGRKHSAPALDTRPVYVDDPATSNGNPTETISRRPRLVVDFFRDLSAVCVNLDSSSLSGFSRSVQDLQS